MKNYPIDFRKVVFFFLLCWWSTPLWSVEPVVLQRDVRFYSERVSIRFANDLPQAFEKDITENKIVSLYQLLDQSQYAILLEQLHDLRNKWALNDWLFYDLIQSVMVQIKPAAPAHYHHIVTWFLLSKSGYDTRITYLDDRIYLYGLIQEEIFEMPMIKVGDQRFANLVSARDKDPVSGPLNMLRFQANPGGSVMQIKLDHLPGLKPDTISRLVQFEYSGHSFEMMVKVDRTLFDVMASYPVFAEGQYMAIPLSETVQGSLLPQLRQAVAELKLNQQETIELLVSFTRSAFDYKEDNDQFGRSRPMIADEVFLHPFSDCEDRTALLFRLIRSLVDLPVIVLAYPDHVSLAVALDQSAGDPVLFQNRHYYICDPTGPYGTHEIGKAPAGYEDQPFEVLLAHPLGE